MQRLQKYTVSGSDASNALLGLGYQLDAGADLSGLLRHFYPRLNGKPKMALAMGETRQPQCRRVTRQTKCYPFQQIEHAGSGIPIMPASAVDKIK